MLKATPKIEHLWRAMMIDSLQNEFITFVRIKCFKTIEDETLNVFLDNIIVVILRWRGADQKSLWCKVNMMQNVNNISGPVNLGHLYPMHSRYVAPQTYQG